MPKKTVRITIPTNHVKKLADLVSYLWENHVSEGASSPLLNNPLINMTRYEELMTEAVTKRKEALQLHARAEALMQQSRNAFGIGVGQTIQDPDTLYHLLNNIKRFLLVKHPGDEEALSEWGFNVVIGSSSVGAKKKKKV